MKPKYRKTSVALGAALIFFIGAAAVYQSRMTPLVPVPDAAIGRGAALDTLPTMNITARRGEALPTNRWWSPGTTDAWPSPLYAWPLAVRLDETGATIAQPRRKIEQQAVIAEWTDPLKITTPGAVPVRSTVLSWGDWDVTFQAQTTTGQPVYNMTLAEGSPFAFFHSHTSDITVTLPAPAAVRGLACAGRCGSAVVIETPAQQRYVLVAGEQAELSAGNPHQIKMTFPAGEGTFTLAAVAPNSDPQNYLAPALRPVHNTRAEFVVGAQTIQTTFSFGTRTLFGVLPHQALHLTHSLGQPLGSFATLRGTIAVYEGEKFTTTVPRPALLPGVPALQPNTDVKAQLEQDIAAAEKQAAAADVYSAGKDLLRRAQLAELAQAYNTANSKVALQQAEQTLADWCTLDPESADANFFSFDSRNGGILASKHAFGSEHYNDHHFHYGYFIHAAGILERLHPAATPEIHTCISLLINDIAADRDNSSFPYLRYFDPYAGHSWAHGLTPLGDGNNQESTSEAIHAWYAVALWGKTTHNQALEERGLWLMSQEMAAARVYWLNTNPEFAVIPADFPYPMISILWGGKTDYTTFFSAAPAAIHGIQFFPATPALLEYVDTDIVSRLIRPVQQAGHDSLWQNSLALAAAPYGPGSPPISENTLDPVYSPSFARHWLAAWATYGRPAPEWQPHRSCGRVFTNYSISTALSYRFPGDPDQCVFTHALSGQTASINNLEIGWNSRPLTRSILQP